MKGGTSDAIEEQARKEGMLTMIEDGIVKAVKGMTTIEEVLRVISE
jgi:type II secretory ATPase GspE/PulE/Tfp pilus assembly ATPase PilB-like protein